MAERPQRSSSTKYGPKSLFIVLIITAVLAVIFYLSGGFSVSGPKASDREEIADNLVRLSAVESRKVSDITGAAPAAEAEDIDIYSVQTELMTHYDDYDYNAEYYRYWFEDSAIVGDSVAEAIREFDWVNDINVQSEIGISLYSSENVIAGTEWLMPSTIFLTFSANNILSYDQYVDSFISDYTDIINRLKANIPYARIYVQGILPCDPAFVDEYPYYHYRDEYNARLEEMCNDLGVNYFDVSFILEAHPDIYSDDGIHPRWPFYPLWLTYMAEISGLAEVK